MTRLSRAPGKAAAAPEHGARRRYLHPRKWGAERLDLGLCRTGERRHPRVVRCRQGWHDCYYRAVTLQSRSRNLRPGLPNQISLLAFGPCKSRLYPSDYRPVLTLHPAFTRNDQPTKMHPSSIRGRLETMNCTTNRKTRLVGIQVALRFA
jgi:hypothetical protein